MHMHFVPFMATLLHRLQLVECYTEQYVSVYRSVCYCTTAILVKQEIQK